MSRDKLLRQVELNTISSSFGSLSGKLSAMHAELLPRWVAPPVTGETASRCRRQITSPHISPHLTASGCPRKIISPHIWVVPPREDAVFKPRGHCTCARPRVRAGPHRPVPPSPFKLTGDTASLQDMHASLAAGLFDGRLTSAPPEGRFSDPSRSPPVGSGGRLPPNPCEAEIAAALAEARLGARAVSGKRGAPLHSCSCEAGACRLRGLLPKGEPLRGAAGGGAARLAALVLLHPESLFLCRCSWWFSPPRGMSPTSAASRPASGVRTACRSSG